MTTDQFLKPALKTLGVFSQPPYSSEPYVDPSHKLRSDKLAPGVKPMYCAGGYSKSRAATSDGYFEDFKRVFEGEPLSNPKAGLRSLSNKRITRIWIPSSASKKRCGVGSNYGNFTPQIPALGTEEKEKERRVEPHNFYTNPGKKGSGYGYPNVAINPLPEWMPGEGMHSDLNEQSVRQLNLQHLEKCLGRNVFSSSYAGGGYFEPNPYAGGDPLAPGGPPRQVFGVANFPKEMIIGPTFRIPDPPKKMGGSKAGTFSKFPEYVGQPFKEMNKILHELDKRKLLEGMPIWSPPSGTSLVTPSTSIVSKNVDLAFNPVTRKSKTSVTRFCKK